MPIPPLSADTLQEAIDALDANGGNKAHAAKALGIPRNTLCSRIKQAERRGMLGPMAPALDGFEVRSYSEQVDKNGNVKLRSTRYGLESGGEWSAPEGTVVKRGTVQTGPDGRIERQWHRYSPDEITPEKAAEAIRAAFEGWTPFAPATIRAREHDRDRMTVYVLADWHIGMFAWGRETDGPDWDLTIAREVITKSFLELVDLSPASESAIVLGLGDLMHADNPRNQTPNSGNPLDVDTRYAKVLPATCAILADCCEAVRAKHRTVEVEIKPGNHDTASTVGIREALRMFYRNDARVTVGDSPSPFFWKRWGVNLICGTHGDGVKAKDLPLVMANVRASDWSEAVSKHAHTGHLHHELTFEHGGVKVHQHRAPIPADAFHHANGYRSGRSMRAFHYHRELGARGSSEVEIN
jgi:hypothetical protein